MSERPEMGPDSPQGAQMPQSQQAVPQWPSDGDWWKGGRVSPIGETFATQHFEAQTNRRKQSPAGKRSRTGTTLKRGRYISAKSTPDDASDLAFDATLRAAAPYQQRRQAQSPNGPALHLRPQDYHKKVRVRRAANLVIFVVDASWSMAVTERMEATKGAVFSLLTDAYQRRDRVGLVVFNKDRANVILPPTNSVELAKKMLVNLPVGGKTPLAAGLWTAFQMVKRELQLSPELLPLMIILTDGAGNVSMGNIPPQAEAYKIADQIHEAEIDTIVINMEDQNFDQGLAQALAEHLGGVCYNIEGLRADVLFQMVRDKLQ